MANSGLQERREQAKISKELETGYDYSFLVTGVTGSGKSSLCNFLCCDSAFETKCGFASVTAKSAAATITMQDKRVKLIDTPGFCDEYETEEEHMKELSEALLLASKGVHAIGLVINAAERYTDSDVTILNYLTGFKELWPYMFLLFSNAGKLGDNEEDRHEKLKDNLKRKRIPQSLIELIEKVEKRYFLIESVNPDDDPVKYYDYKVNEMLSMIKNIQEKNKFQVYTNSLFIKAKESLNKAYKEKEIAEKEFIDVKKMAKNEIEEKIRHEEEEADAKMAASQAIDKKLEHRKKHNENKENLAKSFKRELEIKELERKEKQNERDAQYQGKEEAEKKCKEIAEKAEILLKEEAEKRRIREEKNKAELQDMQQLVNEERSKKEDLVKPQACKKNKRN